MEWADKNEKLYDIQAGFRKGKGTIDNIFVLQCLIDKYFGEPKGRFHSVFVDFSKEFDSVPHCQLFYSLLNGDRHGRTVNVL